MVRRGCTHYGAIGTHRGTAYVSTPLTVDGSVRARVVGTYQDGNSYLDG